MDDFIRFGTLTKERYVFVDGNHNGKADLSDTVNVIQEEAWGLYGHLDDFGLSSPWHPFELPLTGWTSAKVISSRTLKDFLSTPPLVFGGESCRDVHLSRFEDLAAVMPASMDLSTAWAYLGETAFHCDLFRLSLGYQFGPEQERPRGLTELFTRPGFSRNNYSPPAP